jgi:hypothetical protein
MRLEETPRPESALIQINTVALLGLGVWRK